MFQSGMLTFQSKTFFNFFFENRIKILHNSSNETQILGIGSNIKFQYLSGTLMFQIAMIALQIGT